MAEEAEKAALKTEARNKARFEQYKNELREQMSSPHVQDPQLKEIMKNLYKSGATEGSGSTAAAVRLERKTGEPLKGRMHSQKAADRSKQIEKWLRDHPTASPGDRAGAENVLRDMQNALEGN